MSKRITPEMLSDEGIRSALELLQEQVNRYDNDTKGKIIITGESITSHLMPVYYIREFKKLTKKVKSRQYNIQLAAIMLMLHLSDTVQLSLVKNAEIQFKLLRDSTPETLNKKQLETLIKEVEAVASTVRLDKGDAR